MRTEVLELGLSSAHIRPWLAGSLSQWMWGLRQMDSSAFELLLICKMG